MYRLTVVGLDGLQLPNPVGGTYFHKGIVLGSLDPSIESCKFATFKF